MSSHRRVCVTRRIPRRTLDSSLDSDVAHDDAAYPSDVVRDARRDVHRSVSHSPCATFVRHGRPRARHCAVFSGTVPASGSGLQSAAVPAPCSAQVRLPPLPQRTVDSRRSCDELSPDKSSPDEPSPRLCVSCSLSPFAFALSILFLARPPSLSRRHLWLSRLGDNHLLQNTSHSPSRKAALASSLPSSRRLHQDDEDEQVYDYSLPDYLYQVSCNLALLSLQVSLCLARRQISRQAAQ